MLTPGQPQNPLPDLKETPHPSLTTREQARLQLKKDGELTLEVPLQQSEFFQLEQALLAGQLRSCAVSVARYLKKMQSPFGNPTFERRIRRGASTLNASLQDTQLETAPHAIVRKFFDSVRSTQEPPLRGARLKLVVVNRQSDRRITLSADQYDSVKKSEEMLQSARSKFAIASALRSGLRGHGELITKAENTLAKLHKVFHLDASGYARASIARIAAVGTSTVERWLAGSLPRDILVLDPEYEGARPKPMRLTFTAENATSWAYVFGAFSASKGIGERRTKRMEFLFDTPAEATHFQEILASIHADRRVCTGQLQNRGYTHHYVRSHSVLLRKELNTQTAFNTKLPWVVLGTENERLSFLKGYFASSGSVTHDQFFLRKTKGKRHVLELAILLDSVGITPTLLRGKVPGLAISDKLGLERLDQLGIVTNPDQQEKLRQAIRTKTGPVSRRAEEYYAVLNLHSENPDLSWSQLAAKADLSLGTVRSWVNGTSKPAIITRREQLNEVREQFNLPEIQVLAEAYKIAPGVPRELLFAAARNRNVVSLLRAVEQVSAVNLDPGHTKALLGWSRIEEILNSPLSEAEQDHERRERLMAWASREGVPGDTTDEILWQMTQSFLPRLRGTVSKILKEPRAQYAKVDREDLEGTALILTRQILDRFDPAKSNSYEPLLKSTLSHRLLDHINSELPGTRYQQRLAARVLKEKVGHTEKEIKETFHCRPSTAKAVLEVLRGLPVSLDNKPMNDQDERPRYQPPAAANSDASLNDYLDGATDTEAQIITLFYRDGLTLEEIGHLLNMPTNEVADRRDRYLEILRSSLDRS